MTDTWTIRLTLFLAGIVPFTLLGGWGEYSDHSILPWSVGFLCQAGVVLGFIVQRRGWWSSNRTKGA